jgi:hypothetical protein
MKVVSDPCFEFRGLLCPGFDRGSSGMGAEPEKNEGG